MKKNRCLVIVIMVFLIFPAASIAANDYTRTASGMAYQDIVVGTGELAVAGRLATIHFAGWIDADGERGKLIYNSRDQDQPLKFKIGTDRVIKGWNEGIVGMRVGGKRRLMIPSHLGYGAGGSGDVIPPDTDLIFEIELIKIK